MNQTVSDDKLNRSSAQKRPPIPNNAAPGLLVSVRSADEASSLAGLNIPIIDLKEPNAGPLAPVDPLVWRQVASAATERSRLSAALGEFEQAVEAAAAVPTSFSFAKMGPAGSISADRLIRRWQSVRERLEQSIQLVAVAYADHEAANCPSPERIFAAANAAGMRTWLIDTFAKDGQSTFDHLTLERLHEIDRMATNAGAQWVLAGSMNCQRFHQVRQYGLTPRWIGVRGDVCTLGRTTNLCVDRVRVWLEMLDQAVPIA